MLRHFVLSPKTINRLAIMGILPMMVLSILAGMNSSSASTSEPPELPREGTLVIANLRDPSRSRSTILAATANRTSSRSRAPPTSWSLPPAASMPPSRAKIRSSKSTRKPPASCVRCSPARWSTASPSKIETRSSRPSTARSLSSPSTVRHSRRLSTNATGDTPHTVAILDGAYYITDSRDGTLRRIDTTTGASTTVPAGVLPESVTVAGQRIAVADAASGQVSWFSPDLELVGRVTVGGTPVRVITLDDERVIVSLNSDTHIAVVNLRTGEIERRIKVAGHPDGLCLSPSGRFLAIASNQYDSVNVFRTTDWKLMVTLEAGNGPGACVALP